MNSETRHYGHWNLTIYSDGTARLWHPKKRGASLKRVLRNGVWTWVFGDDEQRVHSSLIHDMEIVYARIGGV